MADLREKGRESGNKRGQNALEAGRPMVWQPLRPNFSSREMCLWPVTRERHDCPLLPMMGAPAKYLPTLPLQPGTLSSN